MSGPYLLITPCRDEAKYLKRTIDAVAAQTVLPALWVIVDDGSTDETPDILSRAEQEHAFIRMIRRSSAGGRRVGPGVIEAFYDGLNTVELDTFEYVCKFDGDLDIPAGYFERIIQRMDAEPRLGTCSGKPYFPGHDGSLISEACGNENSVGMIKFYRMTCFREIGGFVRQVMWDGIDGHRCRMLGWIAESVDDDAIRFVHLRPMGSSHAGILRGRMRHGYGQYFMGTAWWYMLASAVFRMSRPPRVVGGAAMMWGWLRSALRNEARYDDMEFRTFLRHYQWNCLMRGKRKATALLNAKQASTWLAHREKLHGGESQHLLTLAGAA